MIRLLDFLIQLAEIYPIAMSLLNLLVVIGFVSILRWISNAAKIQPPPVRPSMPQASPTKAAALSAYVAKDTIRTKLEDLYAQKKIAKEILDDLLTTFQIWMNKPSEHVSTSSSQVSHTASAPSLDKPIPSESVPQRQVAATLGTGPKPSGYFSSENIKTMLISGCALFVLSAYLFVRSYWEHIPAFLKFLSLVFMTVGIHIGGKQLIGKKETPKTAETLLTLAALLVPFNVYAGNYLLLDGALSAYSSWALGSAAMLVAGLYTASFLSTPTTGSILGAGFMGMFIFGSLASSLAPQTQYLVMATGALSLLILSLIVEMKEDIRTGLHYVVNGACALVIMGLVVKGLFLNTNNHFPAAATLFLIGGIFAIEARTVLHTFAYGAGLCFAAAIAVLLHNFDIPGYKYGLFFIPASILATVRAWSLERQGKKDLAAPYFHLGQLGIAGSIFGILPGFALYMKSGFATLLAILVVATAAYAINGILYRNPLFTYIGGAVILFMAWTCTWHYRLPFTEAVLLMSAVGSFFVIAGLITGLKFDDLLGQPLSVVGLGSVTVCLALLAGKWGLPFLQEGALQTGLAKEQLTSALWVGGMGVVAYGLVAALRKQAALIFPALASATLTYFFYLEKISYPINLVNTSLVVLVSMLLAYITSAISWSAISRCFSVWGEMVFAVVTLSALATRPETALPAVLICLVALLPGLLLDRTDITSCFLSAVYAAHLIWFRTTIAGTWDEKMFSYGAQLLFLNCGVVFLRTLISAWRSHYNILPYKVAALAFSALSLVMVLSDKSGAWQIYLAYGLLALLASMVHYQGRFNIGGTTLLMLSYELLLWSRNVQLTEAYSVPAGLYVLICGYLSRDNKDMRNILYGIAQGLLYLPSFSEAIHETWEIHGVFLGVASLAVMLLGIHQRNKCLTLGSLFVLLTNGVIQSFQFLSSIPRWIYLAAGGTTLVSLGGLFEFQRETLIAAKKQVADAFEGWD